MKPNPKGQKFFIEPENRAIFFEEAQTLLEALLAEGVEIDHSCGGMGSCGTCCVRVQQGLEDLESRNEIEEEMADDRGFADDERLSCQTLAHDGLRIFRKPQP
jgi:ferredoxin